MVPVKRWRVIGLAIYIVTIFFITGALTQRAQSLPAVMCMGLCCAMVPISMFIVGYVVYVKTIKLPE